ncbi:DUF1425 domain-containing protein [Pedosphaera parvula]|uniref:Lipoprotein n=1 Tax=Pedosphaera parvula (strain Ellin514) TaxID=320771 RepID=B9XQW2_PEDPL|nr:YcfL family protein [Pedosphaera parvula]EEF57739.1 conserved hypothetical protein [Pedosphaera parvula Ellin514]
MKRTFLAIGMLATAAALLTGCETTPRDTGAYVPVNTTVNDLENHTTIVLMDPRVQISVTCSGIQQRTLPDGRLEVTANLRNRENRRIQVQASCVFKDEQGFPTEGESVWHNVILTENGQDAVTFTAMNTKAKKYTIRIREAH